MSLFQKKSSAVKTIRKKVNPTVKSQVDSREIIDVLLGPVLVDQPVIFTFDGALERTHAHAIWEWLARDVEPSLIEEAKAALLPNADIQVQISLATKVARLISTSQSFAQDNVEFSRRIQIQLGGEEVYERLEHMENVFRNQQLLSKAVAFGNAINGVRDQNSLKLALQAFPVDDPKVSSIMMHAAMGQVSEPNRLVSVIIDLSDGHTQNAITKAGYASTIEALIAHAQNQISFFANSYERFVDIDMNCRALDRYHRLIRALSSITENDKKCDWAFKVGLLVCKMSELIEPRLTKIDADVRQSLRKPRIGPDSLDSDLLLDALNGLYLLAAAREALDTLALNSIVSNLWNEVGSALEILIGRNLEAFREAPQNEIVAQRLNTGIKMAEIRFNPEYATILTRARDGASRRSDT